MAKIHVEVCIISARGLRRSSSSLWKRQWFAVGWIDPDSKYCTKIDSSGRPNPTWKTKFSVSIDDAKAAAANPQGLALTVEVYRRDPVFLREKLQGTATVPLKEFLARFSKDPDASRPGGWFEEVGSYQLRKRSSVEPRGFVDVSVRISEEGDDIATHSGSNEGYGYWDKKNEISLAIEDGPVITYPTKPPPHAGGRYGNYQPMNYPYEQQMPSYLCAQPTPFTANDPHPPASGTSQGRTGTPPPPPPPTNAGFIPSFFPGTSHLPENYVNWQSSGTAAHNHGPGFGVGLGAGALAAGAVIFGDDFMSSPNFPAGFGGGSFTLSADPPF